MGWSRVDPTLRQTAPREIQYGIRDHSHILFKCKHTPPDPGSACVRACVYVCFVCAVWKLLAFNCQMFRQNTCVLASFLTPVFIFVLAGFIVS